MEIHGYNIYTNKDGRMRAYDKKTHKVFSYPRLLMSITLGRELEDDEDVHHIDGNPLNNNIENLEVINHTEHDRQHAIKKYFDKEMVCPICKTVFLWTAKQQKRFKDSKRKVRKYSEQTGPYCSRHCAGIANQRVQMNNK